LYRAFPVQPTFPDQTSPIKTKLELIDWPSIKAGRADFTTNGRFTMKAQNFFVAIAVFLALAACRPPEPTSPAQPMAVDAQGSYRHAPSGMTFPPTVGDFERANITQFDAAGDDIGVGYNRISSTGGIAATVYVYPAPSLVSIGSPPDVVASAQATLCSNEFARREKEVVGVHPGARLIEEKTAPSPGGGRQVPGEMAAFEYDDLFGGQRRAIHSELYVFCYVGGKWSFEYRFSSFRSLDAREAIATFMAALPWTVPSQ
jgi:hypothetical protein